MEEREKSEHTDQENQPCFEREFEMVQKLGLWMEERGRGTPGSGKSTLS